VDRAWHGACSPTASSHRASSCPPSAEGSDDVLLDAMLEHPILINRPIVVTELGAETLDLGVQKNRANLATVVGLAPDWHQPFR
jgi:hypothetical protein